ncbi:cytochrome P450 [Streptomyces sp. NPDC046821]|uniref:cytochrome P450 n=1 Tax=Streptomyces sp. NPDC046821 TaxID=3154702 RepID=UPI0033D66D35
MQALTKTLASTESPALTKTLTFPLPGSTYLGPDPEFARLRAERPVARMRLDDGREVWMVTRYDDIREGLADPRLSRAAAVRPEVAPFRGMSQVPPEMIVSTDPPEHTRLRKLVSKVFTVRGVEKMRPRVTELVDELLDTLAAGQPPADLVAGFTTPLPLMTICELLGVPAEDRDRFHGWARQFAAVGGPPEQIQDGIAKLGQYIGGLIAQKRAEPADDLLSELIAARDEGDRLTEEELVVFGYTLLGAGFDSSASQIANSVLALIEHHPDQWRWLRQNPDRVADATEELLRAVNLFGTDTTGFPRIATEDLELGGTTIRAGEMVLFGLTSANHDASVFPDPDRLDLGRTDNRHLAFGHGIHRCLGAQLARMELQVALGALVRRFPDLRLAVPETELTWQLGDVNHTLLALPVTWGKART